MHAAALATVDEFGPESDALGPVGRRAGAGSERCRWNWQLCRSAMSRLISASWWSEMHGATTAVRQIARPSSGLA